MYCLITRTQWTSHDDVADDLYCLSIPERFLIPAIRVKNAYKIPEIRQHAERIRLQGLDKNFACFFNPAHKALNHITGALPAIFAEKSEITLPCHMDEHALQLIFRNQKGYKSIITNIDVLDNDNFIISSTDDDGHSCEAFEIPFSFILPGDKTAIMILPSARRNAGNEPVNGPETAGLFIDNELLYQSYAANRDEGMTHKQLANISIARPGFMERYEKEGNEHDKKS